MTILPLTYLGSVDWFAHLVSGMGKCGGEKIVVGVPTVIDIGERWVKQTARNRAEILTAGGVATLTVPVHGGAGGGAGHGGSGGEFRGGSVEFGFGFGDGGGFGGCGAGSAGTVGAKIRTRDVRIDNSKRWQHVHWQAMVSAYRNSPFFEHYEERFAPFYHRRFDFLVDLNLGLLEVVTSALKLEQTLGGGGVKISEDWVYPSPGDLDLRGKKALRRADAATSMPMTCNPAIPAATTSPENLTCNHSATPAANIAAGHYTQVFSDRMPFVPGLSIVDLLFAEGPAARSLLTPPAAWRS